MPWKVNEDGAIAVEGGNPVWVYEGGEKDGKEAPVEFGKTLATISRLTGESTERKAKLNELTAKYKPLEDAGIEDLADYLGRANKALETVANLDDKQVMDAGQIEKIKEGVAKSYEAKIEALKKTSEEQVTKLSTQLSEQDKNIRNLVIRGAFDRSEFLKEKTVLLPDMAFSYFGDRFDIEVKDGKPVGFAKDKEGNPLMSLANPGEIADPVEAIELLVMDHPQRDRILRMESSGSGTPPAAGGDKSGASLLAQYNKAKENKDVMAMTSLKNQMQAKGMKAPL
jgi:hypothetical protein